MPRIRVVLDTNIVVSAHLNSEGYERFVLDLVLAERLELWCSPDIFAEYEGVLRRKKFAISPKKVNASLRLLRTTAHFVSPHSVVTAASDPQDKKFLKCPQAARAEYLVTGNRRHFSKHWQSTLVVNAREFIERIVPEIRR